MWNILFIYLIFFIVDQLSLCCSFSIIILKVIESILNKWTRFRIGIKKELIFQ